MLLLSCWEVGGQQGTLSEAWRTHRVENGVKQRSGTPKRQIRLCGCQKNAAMCALGCRDGCPATHPMTWHRKTYIAQTIVAVDCGGHRGAPEPPDVESAWRWRRPVGRAALRSAEPPAAGGCERRRFRFPRGSAVGGHGGRDRCAGAGPLAGPTLQPAGAPGARAGAAIAGGGRRGAVQRGSDGAQQRRRATAVICR